MRFLIFLLLVAAGFPSKGQFQNVQIYKQENGHSAVGVPSVAINPRQPMNRVVASLPGNVYQSADGGEDLAAACATW